MMNRTLFAAALVLSPLTGCGNQAQPNSSVRAAAPLESEKVEGPQVTVLRGMIQYESPCIRADFPMGCLRLWTVDANLPGGNLKYIDRSNRDNSGAEFNVVDTGTTTLYRLWYNQTDSILLSHQQPVALTVELDEFGTTIVEIHAVTLTGSFDGQ